MTEHEDEELLRATALENARTILAARRRAEEELLAARKALEEERLGLELLNATALKLGSQLDQRSLLQAVTDAATEICGAKFGAFFYNVVTPQGEAYQLFTLSGAPREAFEKFGMPRNTPVFEPTFSGTAVVRSDDITKDERYGKMAPHHGMPQGHLSVRSYLAVPVRSRSGEVLGGLFFGHPLPAVFNERAERLVEGIAAHAAIAIDNARLYDSERRARAEAERQSEIKEDFLATLSHELRTPLGAILGWAQVMASRRMEPEEMARAVQVIEHNARAQTRLIEDLLDMSRITSGKVRLDIQPLYPAVLVQAALETLRPAAEAKGVRMESVLDPKAGPVSGDPSRLQQIVWNLLSNAVKFTPRGGKVQVVLQRVNSHIEISVADTGIGIRPEFLPHVFDRFRQADSTTTRGEGGLGIGLSIAKHLVDLHGGTLRAASLGEGRGATFTVELPMIVVHPADVREPRAHPAAAPGWAVSAGLPDLSGLLVLAVDDHADALDLVRRVLEDCGARVTTAASAAEALAVIARETPNVLVTDIGMPGSDGYDLLKRVRELGPHYAAIPAIALTAFARPEDRTKVLRAGFRLHMAKPVEPVELCVTVANAAGRSSP